MFLCEAALGKQRLITRDGEVGWDEKDPVSAGGFDSCLAVGRTEPDAGQDLQVQFDASGPVAVPQGPVKASPTAGASTSSFSQSEYLVFKESQVRIRYIVQMEFEETGSRWH